MCVGHGSCKLRGLINDKHMLEGNYMMTTLWRNPTECEEDHQEEKEQGGRYDVSDIGEMSWSNHEFIVSQKTNVSDAWVQCVIYIIVIC